MLTFTIFHDVVFVFNISSNTPSKFKSSGTVIFSTIALDLGIAKLRLSKIIITAQRIIVKITAYPLGFNISVP